jgi:hypothetical protein
VQLNETVHQGEPTVVWVLNRNKRYTAGYGRAETPIQPGMGSTGVHPGFARGGASYLMDCLADMYRRGFRRVVVQGPYGQSAIRPPHAIDTGVLNVVPVAVWREVLLWAEDAMSDLRIVMYLGGSSEIVRALDAAGLGDHVREHIVRSLSPLFPHGNVDIMIDTAADWDTDSDAWAAVSAVRDSIAVPRDGRDPVTDRRLWVEPVPKINSDQRDYPSLHSSQFARAAQTDVYDTEGHGAERLVWIRGWKSEPAELRKWIDRLEDARRLGLSCGIDYDLIVQTDEVITRDNVVHGRLVVTPGGVLAEVSRGDEPESPNEPEGDRVVESSRGVSAPGSSAEEARTDEPDELEESDDPQVRDDG